jgi:glycine/D-amino acid oxidase-like deaminating enzyme
MTTNGHRTADFIIIGAGVMGASIAFHLAQRKAGRILILDKNHVASGGSGRSSALIRMHYSFPPEVELALVSLRMFENWRELVGEPDLFHKTGFVRIVHANETVRLRRNVEMQQQLGVNARLIDRNQLRDLAPEWFIDDVELAAYEPESGYGDGAGVANDFLSRARDLGATYLPRTQATAVLRNNGTASGIRTEQEEIHAPVVIVASGPWTRPLVRNAGFDLPIETEYHHVAILKNAPGMQTSLACIDSGSATYFRPDGGDKFLVGDFYGTRPIDPDNFPQRASEEALETLIERACRRIPKLENAEVVRGVTGVYDMTPDSRPLLGEVPGVRGLHVCAGFSGMGFKISPAIGLVMSELILDGVAKTVDIGAFRPSRFVENQPIKAEFEYIDD